MDSSSQDSQQIEANYTDDLHQQQARLGEQDSDAAKSHNHRHNRATQTHPSRRSGKRLETAKAHSARAEYHALVQNDIGWGHEAGERRIEEILATEKDEVEQGKRHQFPSMCFEAGGHENPVREAIVENCFPIIPMASEYRGRTGTLSATGASIVGDTH